MSKVLITGASGLIGKRLSALLQQKGYTVNSLGRSRSTDSNSFVWDITGKHLDKQAFEDVSAIIHLAGAGIAEKRWTDKRKQEIIDSRVKGAELLYDFLKHEKHGIKTFVSSSAVGYYGDCGDEIVTEKKNAGDDFLADVCRQWEDATVKIGSLGIREVRCRTGIVLAPNGGALPELTKTISFGFANYFSKENLFYPWVHIDDVCGIMIHALENENVSGAYNTTAPQPLLMKHLMREILKAKKTNAVLLPVPPIAIKIALGEMSEMLLCSQRCSAEKIMATGYKFKFGEIENALAGSVSV